MLYYAAEPGLKQSREAGTRHDGNFEQIETVQLAGQREFAARTLERETKNLTQIDAALTRIDHGDFGTCLDCEGAIAPKRLAALPWAGYCLHCQELHDAQESTDTVEPKLAA